VLLRVRARPRRRANGWFQRVDASGTKRWSEEYESAALDQHATLQLVPALRAPRAARTFVAETLTTWDVQADEVEAAKLVVSELVTNAVLHSPESATISLDLRLTDGAVRVLVTDGGLGEPERRAHPDSWTDETGRGVWLVEAFTEQWGTEAHRGDGKSVWCELRVDAPTTQ
jgi:anti-sigma regulatory factor (Ser/Thr protein kinase)